MKIEEITKKKDWQDYFEKALSPTFLQTWEWGEFQKKLGYSILRLGLFNDKKIEAIALVVKIKAKRGNFLFIPHGPLSAGDKIYLPQFRDHLIAIGKKEGFSYLRISPITINEPKNVKLFEKSGFVKAPTHMHAENIWVLDINKSEEDLLSQMRKTTRYLVKKALKDEIVIEKIVDKKAVSIFWKVYTTTAEREKFTPFSKNYIEKEFEAFNETGNAIFLTAYEKGKRKCLASALILFTKSGAFYHQGASVHSKLPVTYLMQWTAILEAKKRGCTLYNFWGIAPTGNEKHPWYGLTLFKKGFGGYQIDYIPAQDLIISPLPYYLTYLCEKLLRWKRNL